MPVQTLDAATVQRASCPKGRKKIEIRDTKIVGFSLEVRASGGKTYYLRYFDSCGRQRQLKIGGVNEITFAQAAKAAQRLRADVVLGGSPLAAKQEKRSVSTYGALAEQHIAHAKTYQKSWWSTEGIIRKHLVPRWGRMRLDEITSKDIAQWLADKAVSENLKPATIEKIRVVMGKSFALALEWQMPGSDRNPVRGVRRPVFDNKKSRLLTREEVKRLLDAAGQSPNPQLRPIVHLLMLTGARVSELLHAKWEHVDLNRKLWHIPMSKNGKGRHVPLAGAAVEVIQRLQRFDDCFYLVPNQDTLKPFVTLKKAWQTVRKNASIPDLRIHDLRHHCASSLVSTGASLLMVSKLLGHRDLKSSERYSFLAEESLMRAVEAGAAGHGDRNNPSNV